MTNRHDEGKGPDRWDWTTVVFVVLGIVILAALTFELWAPRPYPH